jgi:hypothetical protein
VTIQALGVRNVVYVATNNASLLRGQPTQEALTQALNNVVTRLALPPRQ